MLEEVCKMIDEYCEKTDKKIVMCAVEINEVGDADSIVFHRVCNPVPALGMINILQNLLDSQEVEINEFILNEGVKSDSRNKTSQIMQLIARFEALKQEGEKVKDTNPIRLLEIMSELKDLVAQIKDLDPRKEKDNSDKDSSDKKDNSGDALDDFKNMF
jgi:hypothetical protein